MLLTTLIGAGQGLFVAVFAVELAALAKVLPSPIPPWYYRYGACSRSRSTGAGLVASFFHLGRPARAWRSAAQWRTSWLSREVIVLPAFMAVIVLYALAHFLGWNGPYGSPVGQRERPDHRDRRRRYAARVRALRLHGDDLRVPAVPARMGDTVDRDQLRAARPRVGVHAGGRSDAAVAPEIVQFLAAMRSS